MEYQERDKPYELKVFEALDRRMEFEAKDRETFIRLKDDFAAKINVDQYTRELRLCCSVRYDLELVTKQGTSAHIDTLIFTQEAIHFYFIKNLVGPYQCKGKAFLNKRDGSLFNPSATFNLVQKHLSTVRNEIVPERKVIGHLVFPNSDFSLLNEPTNYSVLTGETMEEHFRSLLANELKYIYDYYRPSQR